MGKNKFIKKFMAVLGVVLMLIIIVTLYANWKIPHETKSFVFDNVVDVPTAKTALVLGTSKYLGSGELNLYFKYRMDAAKELYDAGKIEAIVVSGDNSRKSYNEPADMKEYLVGLGVPDSIIYLDYAGFRTLDSVVRMDAIFDQKEFIVVSQKFHNERAIYLAQDNGCIAYGYNAKDLGINRFSIKTILREKLARVKVFVDLFLNKKPKYLGEKIIID